MPLEIEGFADHGALRLSGAPSIQQSGWYPEDRLTLYPNSR